MNIQNLVESILKRIPNDLSEIEQARYVYIELGKIFIFDEEYWLGSRKEQYNIYKASKGIKDFKDLKSNKIICVSLSNIYNQVLNILGIKAYQGYEENKEKDSEKHVFSIVEISGKKYKMDLQRDLHNIQARLKTTFFMQPLDSDKDSEKEKELIELIDKKIQYNYDGEKELKELGIKIEQGINDFNTDQEKIRFVLELIDECEIFKNMGYTERMWLYNKILSEYFCIEDGNKFCVNDVYRINNGEKEYTRIISSIGIRGNVLRMIYSVKLRTFVEITEEQLNQLLKKGLIVMHNKKIPRLRRVEQEDPDR